MVRNRARTSQRCSWDEEIMNKAVRAVKIDKMPLQTAAKTFNVPRNTLRRRIKNGEQMPKFGDHTTLGRPNEQKLTEYLMKLDKIGYGFNFKDLRQLVYRFVVKNKIKHSFNDDIQMAGEDWCRPRGLTCVAVDQFYDNLYELMTKYALLNKPSHIFDCDESGLQLIYQPKNVISERGKRSVFRKTNCEKGETVSLLACCSASGQFMPPFVIMKGKRSNPNYEVGMPSGTKVILSESGYMKAELLTIFLDHFLLHKPLGPVILVLDGHGSHCSDPDSLQKAQDNDVHLLCLPPHTPHHSMSAFSDH